MKHYFFLGRLLERALSVPNSKLWFVSSRHQHALEAFRFFQQMTPVSELEQVNVSRMSVRFSNGSTVEFKVVYDSAAVRGYRVNAATFHDSLHSHELKREVEIVAEEVWD